METVQYADGVEVIAPDTFRRRDRNVARAIGGLDVLPPDVQTKVGSIRDLDGASQATAVTAMLSHARTGLLAAIHAQDLPQIVEWKQKASAIQEIAKQVRMGKEFQLEAAEFVRRAERGLGVAIRDGQANGTVETKSDAARRGTVAREVNQGRRSVSDTDLLDKIRPRDLAPEGELHGARSGEGIYDMADGVSDEQFEEALAEAKAEENLSRANVARKAKAKSQPKSKPESDDSLIAREDIDPAPKKTVQAKRTIERMSIDIGNYALAVQDLDPREVDTASLAAEIKILNDSLSTLRRFMKAVESQ